MARTIAQMQAGLWAAVLADPVIGTSGTDPLTSTSKVAIYWVWSWIVATAMAVQEGLFDAHKTEVNGLIATLKPHTLEWYTTIAKAFQYGDALPADMDTYAIVRDAGDPAFVVNFAAAVELSNLIRIKVATSTAGVLGALGGSQMTSLTNYMGRVKDAGVRLQITTAVADTFQPTMVIHYDPLVLDPTGARIDGTSATPVKDAINAFLAGLPFNGVFILNNFIGAMQEIDGVVIAAEVSVQAFYGVVAPLVIDGTNPQYVPDAGYLALDTGWFAAHVSYVPYV